MVIQIYQKRLNRLDWQYLRAPVLAFEFNLIWSHLVVKFRIRPMIFISETFSFYCSVSAQIITTNFGMKISQQSNHPDSFRLVSFECRFFSWHLYMQNDQTFEMSRIWQILGDSEDLIVSENHKHFTLITKFHVLTICFRPF